MLARYKKRGAEPPFSEEIRGVQWGVTPLTLTHEINKRGLKGIGLRPAPLHRRQINVKLTESQIHVKLA